MRLARTSSCALLTLAALLLAPVAARAGDEPQPAAPAGSDMRIEIGKEEVPIEDFLRVVSETTGIPLIWNPADKNIRGKKIIGSVDLRTPKAKLFSQVRALLTFYELVVIPVGPEGYQFQLVMDARQTSSILKLKPEYVKLTDDNLAEYEFQDGLFISTTIYVEHMQDLRNARNALTRIVTGQNIGNVTEVPAARAFVVTDFAPNVVAIYRLLHEMDQPVAAPSTTDGQTVAVALQHASARELAVTLATHFASAQQAPRAPQAAQDAETAPRISADVRTNRILVTGTESEIATVKAAIAMLDVEVFEAAKPEVIVEVVGVKHAAPREIYNALAQLFGNAQGSWSAGTMPFAVLQGSQLVISAAASDMPRIRDLVFKLDVP